MRAPLFQRPGANVQGAYAYEREEVTPAPSFVARSLRLFVALPFVPGGNPTYHRRHRALHLIPQVGTPTPSPSPPGQRKGDIT